MSQPTLVRLLAILIACLTVSLTFLEIKEFQVLFLPQTISNESIEVEGYLKGLPTDGHKYEYIPAPIETYVMENLISLGYNTTGNENADTCAVILNSTSPIYNDVQQYLGELELYSDLVNNFEPISDMKLEMKASNRSVIQGVCHRVKIHPDGLKGIFQSGQLSKSSSMGYMEPLLPTMRHPKICYQFKRYLLNMEYLIHDFYSMCQQIKHDSRLIFVNMGASLDFHRQSRVQSPDSYLQHLYSKFGFEFDHIYAYEITPKNAPAVYELVPDSLLASWHWINVGVDPIPGAKMNPFTMLTSKYTPNDFIVIKLDVDNHNVEVPLFYQLMEDPTLLKIVDQFYFEHHVHQKELVSNWRGTMHGSVKDSLQMMYELRRKGVASHYWP